jgi:Flp pilus assembly protein TadG
LRANDSGAAAVEFAIIALPLLVTTFMAVQAALVFYARSTALAAATQGANAARAYGSTLDVGRLKAEQFIEVVGAGLHDSKVESTTDGAKVTITVTGHAPSIIPFMTFNVTQSASGPIERFVP